MQTLLDAEGDGGAAFALTAPVAGAMWVVATPDLARAVLRATPGTFLAGRANRRILPVLPQGTVLTLDGDEHRVRRRLLAPLFHGDSLEAMAPIIRDIAAGEVSRWPVDIPFAALPRTRFLTLRIATRLLLGVEGQAPVAVLERHLSRALHPYTMLAGVERLEWLGPMSPQAMARRCRAGFAQGIARVHSARTPSHGDVPPDAIDVLRAQEGTDDTRLTDELFALLLAGHETTATALAWALELLARDPVAWDAIAEEADAEERPYLEAVIAEVLRIRPPLVDIAREAAEPVRLGDRDLPAGTLVLVPPPLVHRHGYDEPDRFSPDRFVGRRPDPSTWLPFGGGDRRCLGASLAMLELREVLVHIAKQFELRAAGEPLSAARLHGTALVPERRARISLRPR